MKTIEINLNETIRVKLTDLGKDIYYHQYDELHKALKGRGISQFSQQCHGSILTASHLCSYGIS